ncbi:MAG: uridylate kinase [Planctomycetes bacterium]|nr:uridylate kinase [Planctomycetota bacterium]
MRPPVVFKLGGSLLDLPGLPRRVVDALALRRTSHRILVAGGGPVADFIRQMDHIHHFGEESGHWLAVRGLVLSSHLVASLLPGTTVVPALDCCPEAWDRGLLPILDTFEFLKEQERASNDPLPHEWTLTSDSIAARVAESAGASELVLLKSVPLPNGLAAQEAAARGWVDPYFARYARRVPQVTWIHLRADDLEPVAWTNR